MKATIDIPDDLYRLVKSRSALKGQTIREIAIDLFQHWIDEPEKIETVAGRNPAGKKEAAPEWFGSLQKYSLHARGRHDMESIRKSMVQGRMDEKGIS